LLQTLARTNRLCDAIENLCETAAHLGLDPYRSNEEAEALFRRVTAVSTSSETYLNFAELLASEGRNAEASQWAQRVLDKKPAMPGYLRRRERPWFRSASAMLKRLATTKAA